MDQTEGNLFPTLNNPSPQGIVSNPNSSGDPSARGKANSCYGHGGWVR